MEGLLESLFKKFLWVWYKNDFANVSFKEYKSLIHKNNILYKYCLDNNWRGIEKLEAKVLKLKKINDEYILKGVHLLEVQKKKALEMNEWMDICQKEVKEVKQAEKASLDLKNINIEHMDRVTEGLEKIRELNYVLEEQRVELKILYIENQRLVDIYNKLPKKGIKPVSGEPSSSDSNELVDYYTYYDNNSFRNLSSSSSSEYDSSSDYSSSSDSSCFEIDKDNDKD